MDRGEGPAALPYGDGASGAGGKFRRRPYRRPTPYDRPPLPTTAAGSSQRKEGWLSKIASGATRFLPSLFFSRTPPLFSHQSEQETMEEASHQLPNYNSDGQSSESSEQKGTSEADKLKPLSDTGEPAAGVASMDSDGLASIEKLLKQKTFSRDEFNRLMEVLRSRTSEVCKDDRGQNDIPEEVLVAATANQDLQKLRSRTSEVCEDDRGWNDILEKVPVAATTNQDLQKSVEERWAGGNQIIGNIPDDAIQSNVCDEVGSSPVEIAKAFMESRTSALNLKSHSPLKDKIVPPSSSDFAPPSILSPSLKLPTCWPGAVVQDGPHFLTPQAERSRTEIRHFPRNPYHGSIPSRSVSRFHDGVRSINLSSTRRRQRYPTVLGSSQRTDPVLDDGIATIGPIRRMRQKSTDTALSKGDPSSSLLSSPVALQPSISNPFTGFSFSANQKLEAGASISNMAEFQGINKTTPRHAVNSSSVHPQSSAIAKKILEHLDRTIPSPKDKAAELKLAVARNKFPLEISADLPNGLGSRSDADPQSESTSFPVKATSQKNWGKGKDLFHKQVGDKMVDGTVTSGTVGVQASKVFSSTQEVKVSVEPSQSRNNGKNLLLQPQSAVSDQGTSGFGNAAKLDLLQLQKHQPHSLGNKPSLTSLPIRKPNGQYTISDNGSGFSFPVSRPFATSSEPPTPSILPSFGEKTLQPEGAAVPSFKFGSSGTSLTSVFSFPSTSSAAIVDASSIPEFKFGSDQKRISFSVGGKDAICY